MALGGCKKDCPECPKSEVVPKPEVAAAMLKTCKKPEWLERGECRPAACGGNSPVVNTFPISGVRPDGECNPNDGVQLVPKSIETADATSPCKGTTLDIDGNQLVGRDHGGDAICKGKALEGASFELRNWANKTARIKIVGVIDYDVPFNHERRVAYKLESVAAPNESLCGSAGAKKLRAQLGLDWKTWNDLVDSAAASGDDLIVPIRSELYHLDGSPVATNPKWANQDPNWVHFACVTDALAKRSFYDLYTDDVARSRAALRMLTADYCGGTPMTLRGLNVDWAGLKHTTIEASWGADGARCLGEPRLLYQGATRKPPDNLPDRLKNLCPNCTADQWDTKARTCKGEGGSERTIAKCTACPAEGCNPRELRSFVVPGGS